MSTEEIKLSAIIMVVISVLNAALGSIAVICIAKCAIHFNNYWLLFLMLFPLLICTTHTANSGKGRSRQKGDKNNG